MINFRAGAYALSVSSNYVEDIILDNIPLVNTDLFFVYGAIFLWLVVGVLLVLRPHYIPFTLKTVSLLIVIRSLFIIMTHLGPYPVRATVIHSSSLIEKFTSGADFFFSGHTAFPFLFALIFWRHKPLRIIFIISSLAFAASVLLGHLHYSIDVFAAFFITYSVFHLSLKLFNEDYFTMTGRRPIFSL